MLNQRNRLHVNVLLKNAFCSQSCVFFTQNRGKSGLNFALSLMPVQSG